MNVAIVGAGKVGRALSRALRASRVEVRLVPARALGRKRFDESLVILSVRDPEIGSVAAELARSARIGRKSAVLHMAGAIGPDVLDPLRGLAAGVAQAHPMIAFASQRWTPPLAGGHLLLRGDAIAVRRGRALARSLGMTARSWGELDLALYHAAGGLVANGAAALAAAGARLLERAGAPRGEAPGVLGPLLRSVADNVERLGFPGALTGPIRRGDSAAVRAHLDRLVAKAPELVSLYGALAALQVELSAEIGEATPRDLDQVRSTIDASRHTGRRPRRGR